MKIAIDTRPLANMSATRGIGIYTSHLMRYLKKMGVEMVELTPANASKLLANVIQGVPEGVDLIHYPFFDMYFPTLPLVKKLPTVVTIHDVTPLVMKEKYPPGLRGRAWFGLQKLALKGVTNIVTDSEVSRSDIVKYLGVPKEKIEVVHLAPQDGLKEPPVEKVMSMVRDKYQLPEKFVLYVGDVNLNKNVVNLVKACKQVRIPLVIVGKQAVLEDYDHQHAETSELAQLQREYGNDPEVKRLGFVPIEELAAVYRLASVYCQPSWYEGFGVSVLEAMVCGCPVVATKRGSLQEIGGKAALYTEPEAEKLAKAIGFVMQLSTAQRKRLIQEGEKHAELFSWEQAAQQTYAVYKRAVNQT